MKFKSVGIVGAGQMGSGIAHVFAVAGYDVFIHDIDGVKIDAAIGLIGKNLARQATKGAIQTAQAEAALARIVAARTIDALSVCDLVIESATENINIKKKILADLAKVMKPDAIMAIR